MNQSDEIAREHVSWCRRNGYSPLRIIKDLGYKVGQTEKLGWDDARQAVKAAWESLVDK